MARFVVEPLERGYGITLGNSLEKNYAFFTYLEQQLVRLRLMAFCMSSAQFQVLKEDVTEIMMNIKELAIQE